MASNFNLVRIDEVSRPATGAMQWDSLDLCLWLYKQVTHPENVNWIPEVRNCTQLKLLARRIGFESQSDKYFLFQFDQQN